MHLDQILTEGKKILFDFLYSSPLLQHLLLKFSWVYQSGSNV